MRLVAFVRLYVSKITRLLKNAEILRVGMCLDVDELINF